MDKKLLGRLVVLLEEAHGELKLLRNRVIVAEAKVEVLDLLAPLIRMAFAPTTFTISAMLTEHKIEDWLAAYKSNAEEEFKRDP